MYQELERYRQGLAEYIEATYHISHPTLVAMRAELLRADGVIAQRPYLESTPRYQGARRFADLNIPPSVAQLLTRLGQGRAVFDPPYDHQAQALERALTDRADLLVTTGTGSGKTETFLLPLLGHLFQEAAERPAAFRQRGLRALILYPMNALVNDQLNRLRLLLGRDEVMDAFKRAAGRPPKFARYTGRSLFPGERPKAGDAGASEKLRTKLQPLDFYLKLQERADDSDLANAHRADQATRLIKQLKEQGRWPAKRDLQAWYKGPTGRWFAKDGSPSRVVEDVQGDAELLLRQEVQESPPDILMTNYSMLEYMLLRPLERSIWRRARERFEAQPDDRLLLVLDEAHLYRGAGGAEVALLLRRLRLRLGLSEDRVQVICTSASFEDRERALDFISKLSGKPKAGFARLTGTREPERRSGPGDDALATTLAQVNLRALLGDDPRARASAISPLLDLGRLAGRVIALSEKIKQNLQILAIDRRGEQREVTAQAGADRVEGEWVAVIDARSTSALQSRVQIGLEGLRPTLELGPEGLKRLADPLGWPVFSLLKDLPVAGRLVNVTSGASVEHDPETASGGAIEVHALADRLFPDVADQDRRRAATDALIELACIARDPKADRPLLAARAHAFFRGLPGLWACLDDQCSELREDLRGGPCGAITPQPHDRCACGARALELHTCRDCGAAFAYAYAEDPEQPRLLWAERGEQLGEDPSKLRPVQLLLEGPAGDGRAVWVDVVTGLVGGVAGRTRELHLAPRGQLDSERKPLPPERQGLFQRCPRCAGDGAKISGHMTSGDQPFQELVSTQLLTQPPREEVRTPLKGRKVMIFSDGRQKASRLSGNLKAFSLRDAARPLLLLGFKALRDQLGVTPTLDHAYLALLLGCAQRGVTPPSATALRGDLDLHLAQVRDLREMTGDRAAAARELSATIRATPPEDVLQEIYGVLFHPFTGVEALALASFSAEPPAFGRTSLERLTAPPAPGIAPADARSALLDRWVQLAARQRIVHLPGTPAQRVATGERDAMVFQRSGSFQRPLKKDLSGAFHRQQLGANGPWLVWIQQHMASGAATADGLMVDASRARIRLWDELSFVRCGRCARVQVLSPISRRCMGCEEEALQPLDVSTDARFLARCDYYRRLTRRAIDDPTFAPHPFVAAEHSAAIGQTMDGELFARTEEYELRFQDVPIPGPDDRPQGPVDVLSCTTTMEVGVDIGSLTGVALRNVPPGRANYQQRAGRAGRRGSSLATVITFASADGHDQRFFNEPAAMVGGPVKDPVIKLENPEIVRRQAFALILSMFQQDQIPDEHEGRANLFMSLGSLKAFREGKEGFSYAGLERWLSANRDEVLLALEGLVPEELPDRDDEIEGMPAQMLDRLGRAGAGPLPEAAASEERSPGARLAVAEARQRVGAEVDYGDDNEDYSATTTASVAPTSQLRAPDDDEDAALSEDLLLDRLFAKAVLPRYAFPTDVVSFYVFDKGATSRFRRPVLQYSPQQGLSAALGQYAPGKDVWVDGLKWHPMAIWTPYKRDFWRAWRKTELYLECERCGFAVTQPRGEGLDVGESMDCPACRSPTGMRPAMRWFSPPGFAHPVDLDAELPGANDPPLTRPTRAKLRAPFTSDDQAPLWTRAGASVWEDRQELIVTNAGSDENAGKPGFLFCLRCGRAEPNGWPDGKLGRTEGHPRPTPGRQGEATHCDGAPTEVALGCRFQTDVCLIRLRLRGGASLPPGSSEARIALTSLAEAVATAARDALQLDAGEVAAEHRPAQTPLGATGEEVEIYLYDAVPGGAGYSAAAARLEPDLLERALSVLEGCKEKCERSCYACLRSYQNRWMHGSLDRKLAADLLRHCLHGAALTVDEPRAAPHLAAMASYLIEEGHEAHLEGATLTVNGRSVTLTHPLAPEVAEAPAIGVSLLRAQRALPDACLMARGEPAPARGDRRGSALPRLRADPAGTPAYTPLTLVAGVAAAAPVGHFAVDAAKPGSFLLRLDTPNLEDQQLEGAALREGTWALFDVAPTQEAHDLELKRGALALVVRTDDKRFRGTGASWTLGVVKIQVSAAGVARLGIRYRTHRESGRTEFVALDQVKVLGFLSKAIR